MKQELIVLRHSAFISKSNVDEDKPKTIKDRFILACAANSKKKKKLTEFLAKSVFFCFWPNFFHKHFKNIVNVKLFIYR